MWQLSRGHKVASLDISCRWMLCWMYTPSWRAIRGRYRGICVCGQGAQIFPHVVSYCLIGTIWPHYQGLFVVTGRPFLNLFALIFLYHQQKKLTFECGTWSWRSLMNSMNRMGPRTVPWGTPIKISAKREWCPSSTTHCFLSVRKDRIQLTIFSLNPYFCSFSRSKLWST